MRLIACTDGVTVSIFLKLAPNLKIIGVCLCFVVVVTVLACFLGGEGEYFGKVNG